MKCNVFRLGTVPYNTALELQNIILQKRIDNEIDDTLILLEHPHTFTTGRRGNTENLLVNEHFLNNNNIELVKIGRGGDITYHGPGQLVGYPIFSLNDHGKDVHRFMRQLEKIIIITLENYGIDARRIEKLTGVWVKRSKIASIGVGIKRWTTYHGFALNVNTDLSLFDMINPCGLKEVRMTSIKDWLGSSSDLEMDKVVEEIQKGFDKVFALSTSGIFDLSSVDNDYLIDEVLTALK